MKRVISLVLTAAALATFSSLAVAGTPRSDTRQAHQRARIHQGVHSGSLTRAEAARLRAGQRHVNRVERRMCSDGVVTMRERARIEHAQDRQSHRIYRKKHNPRSW